LRITWHAAFSVGLLLTLALPAAGQELAGTLDQLRVLVKVGDTLTVTDTAGRPTRGMVTGLSSSALELAVSGQKQTFTDNDITSIRHRRRDSLRNGTLIGLGVGVGVAALGVAGVAATEGMNPGLAAGIIGSYAGLGAAIGVGIDAAIRSTQLIYARPGPAPRSVVLKPMFGRGRTGMTASIAF